MAIWSIKTFKSLFEGLDLAAEHYHPEKLQCLNLLNKKDGETVSTIAKTIRHLILPSSSSTIPVFDLGAATKHILDAHQAIVEDRISTKKMAKTGDIIVSRLRSYLKQVAIIPENIPEAAISTEFIVFRSREGNDISYLVPFILSRPVQTILTWSQDGNEHPRFNEKILLDLNIPPSVLNISESLSHFMARVKKTSVEAQNKMGEAEAILNSALGLDTLDLTHRLFYEDTFAHTKEVARLDAEYFSPRMQRVIETLSRDSMTVGDLAPLAKCHFKPASGESFEYIEIADIGMSGTAESKTILGEDAPSRATWIVKPGDIITTTVRPIRRLSAVILPEQDGFVCSSGFAVLRPREIEPELLLTYLRLPLVAELLDLHTTASMYPAISTTDLLRIPVSFPDPKTRADIVSKIQESLSARAESIRLLNEAKSTVEAAILEGG